MTAEILVLERLTRVAPLGVRFWDASTARPVVSGFTVSVYPEDRSWRRSRAYPNSSGVFVAHDLPGLRDASFGDGDDAYWAGVSRHPFVIEVRDTNRHFQPFTLSVRLPARGLLGLECGSPLSPLEEADSASVPVFSTVSRPVPGASAVVRAELWDSVRDRPASWAILEVEYDGQVVGRGMADLAGRVVVIFAYPVPPNLPPIPDDSSPLGPPGRSWPVRLLVHYESSPDPVPELPDLCRVLGQPLAGFVDFPTRTGELPLLLGRDLVVSSFPRLVLLVHPAA